MNPKILNRESIAPRVPTWQQIEVAGEHPAMLGDERVVQVIDGETVRNIVSEFEKDMRMPHFDGLLVDADHLSHDPKQSTEAKAWAVDLEIRNGELWGLLDWTDTGAEAVRGKRYKYFSTEYDDADLTDLGIGPDGVRRVRPRRLAGLALTNRPNNRGGRPITNRKASEAEQTQPTKKPMNKTALEKLGLPETATEEEINAALDELIVRAGKADEMETEAKAEEILNRHARRIPEGQRDAWKKELIANREGAERLILTLPEAAEKKEEGRKPIFNRDQAKQPDSKSLTEGDDSTAADEVKAARISNRARELSAKGQSLTSAYTEAASQIESEDKAKG